MNKYIFLGILLWGISTLLFVYGPILALELQYMAGTIKPIPKVVDNDQVFASETITPVDTEFSLIIPKLRINIPIKAEVDPNNAAVYQPVLTKAVAHAAGTAYPDTDGTTFIFAHSSVNFYEATKYNSVFYLLHRLKIGDEISVFYQNKAYYYQVDELKQVDAKDTSYIDQYQPENRLVLMTCWPPGTTWKRLLVIAKQI